MNRVASALVCVGAVLLLIWQVTPATSAPPPPRDAVSTELDQAAPVLTEVNAQVDRLRERLATTPSYPPPSRDPFNFGRRPDRTPPPAPADAAPAIEPPPPPALPSIVAIVSDTVRGSEVRTAVFSVGGEVEVVASGDTIGAFVVRSIGVDRVVLVERTTGAVFSVKLD